MADTTYYRFVVKRDTAANFTSKNTILLAGEFGMETDTGKLKLSKDGATAWNSLAYFGGGGDDFAVASGADTITATFGTAPTLADGLQFKVRAAAANATTAPTFNPNSLGALTLYKLGGVAMAAGDISGAGHELIIRYRASPARYELVNPASVQSVQAGANVTVDSTDPRNPIVKSTAAGIGLKGRLAAYANLPSTGNTSGDAYVLDSDQLIYIWNGTAWPASGSGVSLSGPGRGVLVKGSAQTQNAVAPLTWNNPATYDSGGYWNSATPTRLTVPTGKGKRLFMVYAVVELNTTASRRLNFRINGTVALVGGYSVGSSFVLSSTFVTYLNDGDYVDVVVAGGTENVITTDQIPSFSITPF